MWTSSKHTSTAKSKVEQQQASRQLFECKLTRPAFRLLMSATTSTKNFTTSICPSDKAAINEGL